MSSTLEFSRPFSVESSKLGTAQTIEATLAERAKLALRFAVPAIETLGAILAVREGATSGHYELEGRAKADLLLTCSISGENYLHHIEEDIRAVFIDGPIPPHTEDMEIDYDWDDPESLENGIIDLGELVAQHIVLAIPAYPRKPDASWSGPTDEELEPQPAPKASPFAILQSLKEHKT